MFPPVMLEEFNLASFLLDRHLAEGRANKPAVYYERETITYSELAEAANRVGNALLGLGVELKNRVMICLPDCPQFLAVYLGAMKIGAVPVPVSTMAVPQDYLYNLNDSRAKALIVHHCKVVSMGETDIVFSTSKLYFSYGRNNSLEGPFLCGAAVVLYPGGPEPEKILDVIEQYHPTLFYSVPSSYVAILTYLDKTGRRCDLSSVRHCVSAGEPLPKVVFERWREKCGLEILDTLGSTDVGAEYLSNKPGSIKPGSSGVLLPGFEGRLIDDQGRDVGQDEIGTLWIKNDGTAAYYWNKHQKTKESLHGEWFNTSDKFYRDSSGFYWYVGRADDIFKTGGMWVPPLEVEGVLLEHTAVNQCAVIGAPDAAGLEKPLAFVVLNQGHTPSQELERELQNFVRSKIAHYKCPRWIRFIDDLPRTASGKVQRYKLRALLGK